MRLRPPMWTTTKLRWTRPRTTSPTNLRSETRRPTEVFWTNLPNRRTNPHWRASLRVSVLAAAICRNHAYSISRELAKFISIFPESKQTYALDHDQLEHYCSGEGLILFALLRLNLGLFYPFQSQFGFDVFLVTHVYFKKSNISTSALYLSTLLFRFLLKF